LYTPPLPLPAQQNIKELRQKALALLTKACFVRASERGWLQNMRAMQNNSTRKMWDVAVCANMYANHQKQKKIQRSHKSNKNMGQGHREQARQHLGWKPARLFAS
jgi:hypothetical protein